MDEKQFLLNEIEIISDFYSKLNIDFDLNKTIDSIIYNLRELIDIDGCNIAIFDNNKLKIQPIIQSNKMKCESSFWEELKKFDIDINSEVWVAKVFSSQTEMHFPEINLLDFDEAAQFFIKKTGTSSFYCLPITLYTEKIGAILFINYGNTMYFSELEKNVIRKRVLLIGRIIQNSKLYNEMKKQKIELEEKKRIIDEDLQLAKKIQMNFMSHVPAIDNVEIDARYLPMAEVGGDYYAFYQNENHSTLGVLITDASGHGIQAALITSMLKMSFESNFMKSKLEQPDKVLNTFNAELFDKMSGNYITALYCLFDFNKNTAKLSCAGHSPLILIRNNEIISYHPSGRILGVFENIHFDLETIELQSGDIFFFYTDGLTEAIDEHGIHFEETLFQILLEEKNKNAKIINNVIIKKLKAYIKKDIFEDDIAIITIKIK